MSQHQQYNHKRYNTQQGICQRQNYQLDKDPSSIQDNSCDQNYFIRSPHHQNKIFSEFINFDQDIKSRYMTCYNEEEQTDNATLLLSNRIKNLMKGLKQLIKELCLTKNATIQIQEELQKIIVYFTDTINQIPSKKKFQANSYLQNLSQIRIRQTYQIFDNSANNISQNLIPGTHIFSKFLQGTSYEDQSFQNKFKINSYQQDLLGEFMDKFIFLLQKQINKISRYNGQKKLKYLLETVMKQIFVHLMRFSYSTKIQLYKKDNKNYLNSSSNKTKVFSQTIKRILKQNIYVSNAFQLIKSSIQIQSKIDASLVNKFETKINFLDNLIKIKQRKEVRQRFLQWKKNSILLKQLEKQQILNGVNQMIREILLEFAIHEQQLDKWKVIVWSKMNNLVKNLCKCGQSILFPVDDELLQQQIQSNHNTFINSNVQSRVRNNQIESDSFRYSPQSCEQGQQIFDIQRKMLSQIHQIFSIEQIKLCIKNGQIMMNQRDNYKIILIPVKAVCGIVAVRSNININSQQIKVGKNCNEFNIRDKNKNEITIKKNMDVKINANNSIINVNSFYNILSALQISTPFILQMIQLKQKFEYFSDRIEQKQYHKQILKDTLQLNNYKIKQRLSINNNNQQQNNKQQINYQQQQQKKKKYSLFSQLLSFTNRDQQNNQLITKRSYQQQLNYIDNIMSKINAKSLFVYHQYQNNYQCCLNYNISHHHSQQCRMIGKDIIQAIMTQLTKLNKNKINNNNQQTRNNNSYELRSLYLRKSQLAFYACPIIANNNIIGFIQIHLNEDIKDVNKMRNGQNTYIVKSVDLKNEYVNQMILLISESILPMIIKAKQNINMNILFKCKYCSKLSNKYQQQIMLKSEQKTNIDDQHINNQINTNILTNLLLQYNKLNQNKLINIQRTIYQFIQSQLYNCNKKQINKISSININQQLINKQFFIKMFYLQTPKTKDNQLFHLNNILVKPTATTTTNNNKQTNFYYYDIQNNLDKQNKKYCKLNFIDKLKLYDNNKYQQPQQISISINQLIDIYKTMIRKLKINNTIKSSSIINNNKQSSNIINQFQNNEYKIFVQQILKSISLKSDNYELQGDKKYHSLQLWLYQLQHLNKLNQKCKIVFIVNINPVFSLLDDKNRFLTAIICSGQFIMINNQQTFLNNNNNNRNNEQTSKQIIINNNNDKNNNNSDINNKNNKMTKLIQIISSRVVGRIIQIQINDNMNKNKNKNNNNNNNNNNNKNNKLINQLQQIKLIIKQQFQNKQLLKIFSQTQYPRSTYNKIQLIQKKLYHQGINNTNNIIKSITYIQKQLLLFKKINIKNIIIPIFKSLHINQNKNIINNIFIIISSQIKNQFYNNKTKLFNYSFNKIKLYINNKYNHYLTYSHQFNSTINNIFIINKLFKYSFNSIKSLTIKQLPMLTKQINSSYKLSIIKKFAIQRITKILKIILFNNNKLQNNQSLIYYSFNTLKSFSQQINTISLIHKQYSIIKIQQLFKKFTSHKCYLPYFKHLQHLQKSLYSSISLIGTEIQTINFYSIYQFLKFINQRLSIIIKSQRKLISVLYGNFVQKINLQIIVQNISNNSFFKLSLSQNDTQKLIQSKTQHSIFNDWYQNMGQSSNNLTKILSTQINNFYLSFEFIQDTLSQNKLHKNSVINFKLIIKKVFQENIASAFNNFFILYQKKIKSFVLKISKIFKLQTHFSKKNQSIKQNNPLLLIKKYVFEKLQNQYLRINKIQKIKEISYQVDRKAKQLQQLQTLYDKRTKTLMSQQIYLQKNNFETIQEADANKIISKCMIKAIKQNIQNLDLNSQNLSIQYQIKSKTVASYQIMQAINQIARKQTFLSVVQSLDQSVLLQSKEQNIRNQFVYKPVTLLSSDKITEQKQKFSYLKVQTEQQKNFIGQRFKKAGARQMVKILKNMNKTTFKKTFYRINSYSCLTSPKNIIQ